jgi:predicted RNase H-like HicB family nuclease
MQLTAVLTPAEEGGFVAMNPETGTTTQGETVEEAIENLKEATALYLKEFPQSGRSLSRACRKLTYRRRRCPN